VLTSVTGLQLARIPAVRGCVAIAGTNGAADDDEPEPGGGDAPSSPGMGVGSLPLNPSR
jgi:hypothetical protein